MNCRLVLLCIFSSPCKCAMYCFLWIGQKWHGEIVELLGFSTPANLAVAGASSRNPLNNAHTRMSRRSWRFHTMTPLLWPTLLWRVQCSQPRTNSYFLFLCRGHEPNGCYA